MLRLAIVFLVVALIAALFGFGMVAGLAWDAAKILFFIFLVAVLGLGWCGGQLPDQMVFSVGEGADGQAIGLNYLWLTRILTVIYFGWFLIQLPLGLFERPLPVPPSISAPVLSHPGGDGGEGGVYVQDRGAASRPAVASPEKRG